MSLAGMVCRHYKAALRKRLMQPDAWRWEYDVFLPWLAKQPWGVFDRFAHIRARLNICLDRHWKMFLPFPGADYFSRLHEGARQVADFYGAPLEEIIHRHLLSDIVDTALVERMWRLDEFHIAYDGAVGTIFDPSPRLWLFAHLDATIQLFPVLARKRKKPIDAVMTGSVVERPLPPPVIRFFQRRSQRFAAFSGGDILLAERHKRRILQALKNQRDMFLALDVPATTRASELYLPLFGYRRCVAMGVLPWAQKHGYIVQTVSAHYLGRGKGVIYLGDPVSARNIADVQQQLNKMALRIESMPEKWGLYEQLPAYPITT